MRRRGLLKMERVHVGAPIDPAQKAVALRLLAEMQAKVQAGEMPVKAQAQSLADLFGLPYILDGDVMGWKVNAHLVLRDKDGNITDERVVHNTICTTGKDKLLAASSAEYPNQFAYLAIGTSSTTPTSADTALGAEIARSSVITPTFSSHVLSFANTFGPGVGTGTIVECGILDAASVGLILSHLTFGSIVKGSSDSLTVTLSLS